MSVRTELPDYNKQINFHGQWPHDVKTTRFLDYVRSNNSFSAWMGDRLQGKLSAVGPPARCMVCVTS
jgi:hypothetical protein